MPLSYDLLQNYPNPFNPVTKLVFNIPEKTHVVLSVSDITGKEVSVIVNQILDKGIYNYSFDGTNFSSGVYFYKIITEEFTACKKMVLVK